VKVRVADRRQTVLISRRALILSIVALLAAILAVPALAEYLGPDRTVLELVTVRDPDNDVWTLINNDPPPGVLGVCLIIHTCEEPPGVDRYSPLCLWGDPPNTNPAESSSCSRAYKDVLQEVTYPEATIAGELQDCDPVNGWCTSDPTLHLTGFEPVPGEAITLIEGTRNGEGFACPGSVCDVPLLQGENSFTFWALSTWGDSSQMGALFAKVDSVAPSILIPDTWKIWEPLAVNVIDSGTGLKSVNLTIHGDSFGTRKYSWSADSLPEAFLWDRYFGDIVAPIGEYPVTVVARDMVGNKSTTYATIVIPQPDAAPAPAIEGDDPTPPTATPGVSASEVEPIPTATQQAFAAVIEGDEPIAAVEPLPSPELSAGSSAVQPLWGAAAAALTYAATNFALSRRKQREEREKQLRQEVAKANANRSLEQRLSRIWEGVKPVAAAIAARQQAERQIGLGETTAAEEAEATMTTDPDRLSPADQATADRWQAMADYYEAKDAQEATSTAQTAREEAHARRRQELADAYAQRQEIEAASSQGIAEPVLGEVPSFWSNPLGWVQANLINAGRSDEGVGRALVGALGPLVDPLKSIADPERNPRTAEFHDSTWTAIEQGVDDNRQYFDTAGETIEAVQQGDWESAGEGAGELVEMHVEGAERGLKLWAGMVWGLVTTPVRLVIHDIPEFAGAVSERLQGQDRGWDVVFTAAMLSADVSGTYGMAKITGVADAINSKAMAGATVPDEALLTAAEEGALIPDEEVVNFQQWQAQYTEYQPGRRLYRVHTPVEEGGIANGNWWTAELPRGEIQWRIDYSVLPEWNTGGSLSIVTVPEGAVLSGWEGAATYQGGFYVGGGTQIYLSAVPEEWVTTIPAAWAGP
jgi:hypothetical protein